MIHCLAALGILQLSTIEKKKRTDSFYIVITSCKAIINISRP